MCSRYLFLIWTIIDKVSYLYLFQIFQNYCIILENLQIGKYEGGVSTVRYRVNGCDSERRRRAAACRVRSPRGGGGGGGERSVAPAWPIRLRADTNFK